MQDLQTHHFFDRFQIFKNSISIIYQDKKYSYEDLSKKINQLLSSIQIPNQSTVALISDYSFESIATLLALSIKKCIIAPLLPHYLKDYLKDFPLEYIIEENTISKLQAKPSHPFIKNLIDTHSSGLILFSSGSTGSPKGVIHNLCNMLNIYAQKSHNPTNTAGIFLPDHIAGIDVLFNQLAIGGTLTIPKDRTPQSICEAIQNHKIQILPASPTFLRLILLSEVFKIYNLNSLKLIVYGSEIMPQALLANLKKALPQTRFKQSFGTSETNAIQTKNSKHSEGFIKPNTPNIQYKIINNQLWLKSKTQTLGYLNADNSVFENGWFNTGDIVETIIEDDEEYFKIIGRSKEIINIGGEKVLPSEIENVISQIEGIQDCLAYGEANAITGQSISIEVVVDKNIFNPKDALGLKKIIREFCKSHLQNYKIPTKVIITESLAINERFKKDKKLKFQSI